MMISITAVSANRQMTKTLVRASQDVNRLRGAFSHIDASGQLFDTVQFVLMDRPDGYIRLEGKRGEDGLYQVHIGANGLSCGLGHENDFVAGLACAIHRAVGELPVSEAIVREMRASIERVNPEPAAAPNSRPPSQLAASPEIPTPDSQRTPSSGGCG